MRHRKRVDGNHGQIRDAWKAKGWSVDDTSHIGSGFPDLVGMHVRHGIVFVEVKDGTKPPSDRRLTSAETAMHALLKAAGCDVRVVERVEDLP